MRTQEILELLRDVRDLRLFVNITEWMTTSDYLECWQCIKDMYDKAKKAGMHGVATQIAALHRAMLDIEISDADDLEYEEA